MDALNENSIWIDSHLRTSFDSSPTYFCLESQPEKFQRKSYPNNKRKEIRNFKPPNFRILSFAPLNESIKSGLAVMRIIDENMESVDNENPPICEMSEQKSFTFFPTVAQTSHGSYYRLHFSINFELEDGQQRTEVIESSTFRVVSRITQKQRLEAQSKDNSQ